MLTVDLVRARVVKGVVRPQYVDSSAPEMVELAEQLIEMFQMHLGEPRGELLEALRTALGSGLEARLGKGLAKLVEDRCTFEVSAPLEPLEIRKKVFALGATHFPVTEREATRHTQRKDVLLQAAEALGITVGELEQGLYADLPRARILVKAKLMGPAQLLDRYNVALAQAVLLRARQLSIEVGSLPATRYRQLFRFIKFFRLMYRIFPRDGGGYRIELDGPLSMFRLGTKYGLQLAELLPALLLCQGWTLRAEVEWGQRRDSRQFLLTPRQGLRSHYPDKGVYETREIQWFKERFAKLETSWALEQGPFVLDLGGQEILIPDFALHHTDGRLAYLEVIGFWRRSYLERHLEVYRTKGPGNLILAVSKQLRGSLEALDGFEGAVSLFREVIMAREIIDLAEEVGTCGSGSAVAGAMP